MKRLISKMIFLLSLQTLLLVLCCHGWSIQIPSVTATQRRSKHRVIRFAEENQLLEWIPSSSDDGWRTAPAANHSPLVETLRWCRNFVLPLNLCPWAAASLQSNNIQDLKLYSVKNANDMEVAVHSVAQLFHDSVVRKDVDPSVAISFVVCDDLSWDFADFYDWFCALEENFWDDDNGVLNHVTLAPFHPDWMFQDEGEDNMASSSSHQLQFEKKSPYPTVTFVWTAVIDAAGPAVTTMIATKNEATLCSKTVQELSTMYQQRVYLID